MYLNRRAYNLWVNNTAVTESIMTVTLTSLSQNTKWLRHVFAIDGTFAETCICNSLDKDVTVLTPAIVNSYGDWPAHTVKTHLHFCVQRDVKTEQFIFWCCLKYTSLYTHKTENEAKKEVGEPLIRYLGQHHSVKYRTTCAQLSLVKDLHIGYLKFKYRFHITRLFLLIKSYPVKLLYK
jgi:hypothetical protein